MKASVTAHVSSKDRYFTTLPSTILSIIFQTVKPEKFILFMDGEHLDLRPHDLYGGIFNLLDFYKIQWEVVFGEGKGQVANHQKAIEMSNTKWIWRLDDDTFATPTVLENLLSCDGKKVGAVGGLIIDPRHIQKLQPGLKPTLHDLETNIQWFLHESSNPIEAEHLYSSFLFKKEAAKHGYCKELSPAGHREETIFSHEMYRNGWKLIINPNAITWHCRQGQGGIRTHQSHPEYWDHDQQVFEKKLREWNVNVKEVKLIILDNGKGDHVMFKSILPQLKKRFSDKELIIAAVYPEIFSDTDVLLISITDAKKMCGKKGWNYDDFNIYKFCSDRGWGNHMSGAFLELYK
jgi:hypothetical protein